MATCHNPPVGVLSIRSYLLGGALPSILGAFSPFEVLIGLTLLVSLIAIIALGYLIHITVGLIKPRKKDDNGKDN